MSMVTTMTMTPTHGKRHSDSISNRYRPATETLSYLNAWTEKQSAPHTQSQGSDMCPEERTTPVPIQEKEGTWCETHLQNSNKLNYKCKAIFRLKVGGQFKWQC